MFNRVAKKELGKNQVLFLYKTGEKNSRAVIVAMIIMVKFYYIASNEIYKCKLDKNIYLNYYNNVNYVKINIEKFIEFY